MQVNRVRRSCWVRYEIGCGLTITLNSYRTEETYVDWLWRFILFSNKHHLREMKVAESDRPSFSSILIAPFFSPNDKNLFLNDKNLIRCCKDLSPSDNRLYLCHKDLNGTYTNLSPSDNGLYLCCKDLNRTYPNLSPSDSGLYLCRKDLNETYECLSPRRKDSFICDKTFLRSPKALSLGVNRTS
jgi:hypothetical protein